MGVKWLLVYRLPPGTPPSQADTQSIAAALDKLCAVPTGQKAGVEATCAMYKQQPARGVDLQAVAKPRLLADLWVVSLGGLPAKCYLIQRKKMVLVEADAHVREMMTRNLEYKASMAQPIRVVGRAWRMGGDGGPSDITIKQLQVTQPGQPPLLAALEVEYSPITYLQVGEGIIRELAEALRSAMGADGHRLELLQPAYDKWFKTDEERRAPFGSSHTAVAYAELLAAALGGLQAEQEAPQADKQQQQAPLLQQQPQPQPQPQQPQQQQPQPPQQQKQQQAPG